VLALGPCSLRLCVWGVAHLSPQLRAEANCLVVRGSSGRFGGRFEYGRVTGCLERQVQLFFLADPDLQEQELQLQFRSYHEELRPAGCFHTPWRLVYETRAVVPRLQRHGDQELCVICLEPVQLDASGLLLACGHLFHTDCIAQGQKQALLPDCCHERWGHGPCLVDFSCPLCRRPVRTRRP
jgi:hypothetical protein